MTLAQKILLALAIVGLFLVTPRLGGPTAARDAGLFLLAVVIALVIA